MAHGRNPIELRDVRDTAPAADAGEPPKVGIVMGSRSDWATLRAASETLERLGVPHECRIVSAHRTPDLLFLYAEQASRRGLEVLIAGAGGAAHLPGMLAAKTWLPVLGVPVQSRALAGIDSLLSIVQMPRGVPVGTLAIGEAGAANAALLATSMLAVHSPELREALLRFRAGQTGAVLADPDPTLEPPGEAKRPGAGRAVGPAPIRPAPPGEEPGAIQAVVAAAGVGR